MSFVEVTIRYASSYADYCIIRCAKHIILLYVAQGNNARLLSINYKNNCYVIVFVSEDCTKGK